MSDNLEAQAVTKTGNIAYVKIIHQWNQLFNRFKPTSGINCLEFFYIFRSDSEVKYVDWMYNPYYIRFPRMVGPFTLSKAVLSDLVVEFSVASFYN